LGVAGDYRGFCFEEPHPGNLYETWTAGSYWGFGGFISTTGDFLKLAIDTVWYQSVPPGKINFSDRKEP
jgi:hypothetical protein